MPGSSSAWNSTAWSPCRYWTGHSCPKAKNAGGVDPHAARVGLVALRGTFTVASSHKLVEVIGADIKDHEVVIFDFSGATYVDDSAAMVIEQLMDVAEKGRTGVIVTGLSGSAAKTLQALGIMQHVPEDHVVGTLDDARRVASAFLRRDLPSTSSTDGRSP